MLKALADPIRLRIVYSLFEEELCVGDLAAAFHLAQPHVSHHLRILRDAKIVRTRREAHRVYYSLTSKMRNKFSSKRDRPVIHLKCCSIQFKGS